MSKTEKYLSAGDIMDKIASKRNIWVNSGNDPMAKLAWYTTTFSLTEIRELELQEASVNFQNLFDDFPHLKNVKVALDSNNTVIVQLDTQDLADLKLEDVGGRQSEEVLEALPAVLKEPSNVTVKVLDVRLAG